MGTKEEGIEGTGACGVERHIPVVLWRHCRGEEWQLTVASLLGCPSHK